MSAIRSIDIRVIDDIFEMGSGFVLDFSDRTFANFFEELNINIDDPLYAIEGTSKAKRLRCFLKTVEPPIAVRALNALWEYRETIRQLNGRQESMANAQSQLLAIINRLGGTMGQVKPTTPPPTPTTAFDRTVFQRFLTELQQLSGLQGQTRGYGFEKFLKDVFDKFGLQARDAFRLRGEQIDGSFLLQSEIYLLEAKWQNKPSDIGDLHTFSGKVEEKAGWTRGLLISYCGFSVDGLHAFGRGKKVICMDGFDMSEAFMRELPLNVVLDRKVRHAGETGEVFGRVRDLFPS